MSITLERRRKLIRDMIESADSRFASVTFIKKNGEVRKMLVQPASGKFNVVGEAAAPSAKQAVETRKANNPHLFAVWDATKKAFRSIDLDTVTEISVNGATFKVAS